MPAAIAAFAEQLFELSARDIDQEMSSGERNEAKGVVDFFAGLIGDGKLSVFVRPFGRTGAQLLDADAWDSDRIIDVIATGTCARPANGDGTVNNFVFLREVEVDAILACYGPPAYPGDIESSRMIEWERRLDSILGSLRGVPEPSRPLRQEDPTPLLDRFPNARIELNTTDITRLTRMGRDWLERQFGLPDNAQLSKTDFQRMAVEEFKPLMNATRFGYVWGDTVKIKAFEHWGKPGRRTKKAEKPKSE